MFGVNQGGFALNRSAAAITLRKRQTSGPVRRLTTMRKRRLIIFAVIVAASSIAVAYGVQLGKRYRERRTESIQCANNMVAIELPE
jgi:hypothetical protein